MRSTSCAQEAKYEACNHRQAYWTVVRSTSRTQEAKYEATGSKNDSTNEICFNLVGSKPRLLSAANEADCACASKRCPKLSIGRKDLRKILDMKSVSI